MGEKFPNWLRSFPRKEGQEPKLELFAWEIRNSGLSPAKFLRPPKQQERIRYSRQESCAEGNPKILKR